MPTIAWIALIALFVLAHLWMHRGHGGHGSHGGSRRPAGRAPGHDHAKGAPEATDEEPAPPARTTRHRHGGC